MATPTLTTDFTVISACDTTDDWTAGFLATDTSIYKENGTSLTATIRLSNDDSTFTPVSALDLTNTHLRMWFLCTWVGMMDIYSNGGVQYFVSDGSNTGYWNMLGSDNYDGGWVLLTIYTGFDVDSGTKPDMSAITSLGLLYNQTTAPKNVANTWWDYFVYGDGYRVTGGTDSDLVTLNDIYTADASAGYGVLQKISGVYFVNGLMEFGDPDNSSDCYFGDTGETLVYTDARIYDSLYDLVLYGGASTSTSFQFGAKVGDSGIQGLSLKSVGGQDYKVTVSGSNIDILKFYGTSFFGASDILLPTVASGSVLNCSFEECGQVVPQDYTMRNCNFINAIGYALVLGELTNDVKDSAFITCSSGINITVSGTYEFDNITFDGCTYDIVNSSGGTVIIEALNGANPQSYINLSGGSVSIENSVAVSIHVEDAIGNDISGARCFVSRTSDDYEVMNLLTDGSGDVTTNYNFSVDTSISVRVRKSSTGTRYVNFSTLGTITEYGYALSVILEEDINI